MGKGMGREGIEYINDQLSTAARMRADCSLVGWMWVVVGCLRIICRGWHFSRVLGVTRSY